MQPEKCRRLRSRYCPGEKICGTKYLEKPVFGEKRFLKIEMSIYKLGAICRVSTYVVVQAEMEEASAFDRSKKCLCSERRKQSRLADSLSVCRRPYTYERYE